MNEADAAELAPEYAAQTGLSVKVCAALLRADLEPPDRIRQAGGWSSAEAAALAKYYPYAAPGD